MRKLGHNRLMFIDEQYKQRGDIKYFIIKIDSNILSGNGIINVFFPVDIFDKRSLLEIFTYHCTVVITNY